MKLRVALLALLALAAAYTGREAMNTLRPRDRDELPMQIYTALVSDENEARFFLKSCGGYVAVYSDAGYRSSPAITRIETAALRSADRAMVNKGIPLGNYTELLTLLEDLGS